MNEISEIRISCGHLESLIQDVMKSGGIYDEKTGFI